MAKKEKEKKEKPLDKLTTKDLKEIALKIEGIYGVHGMNKAELIAAIKEDRGIVDEPGAVKTIDTREIKKQIADLKLKREDVRVSGDKKQIQVLRKKISHLKKKTRRAA